METPDQMQARGAKEIADAGAMTERQMREAKVPEPSTPEELIAYIAMLTDRPHEYGTCCYAMSMAAVAAFNYVAGKLGVTGFQASCADLDILRRTRHLKMGFQLVRHENLLYPQYCTEEHFPTWRTLIEKNEQELANEARKLLTKGGRTSHPNVREHWEWLASLDKEGTPCDAT